jgi:hypothetical protein
MTSDDVLKLITALWKSGFTVEIGPITDTICGVFVRTESGDISYNAQGATTEEAIASAAQYLVAALDEILARVRPLLPTPEATEPK